MKLTKSLKSLDHLLSHSDSQIDVLNAQDEIIAALPKFQEQLGRHNHLPFLSKTPEILQVNVGKMCNQTCKHCHVDAGPDRQEIMTTETMYQILDALKNSSIGTVDLTGGAPEMNPNFRWFVEEIKKLNKKIMVRSNLTIINANKKYFDLPEFFAENEVEVVSSLPFYTAGKTDNQRGDGVFESSIKALKLLNAVGYGMEGTGKIINLVYNPSGAFLPPSQKMLESDFKRELKNKFDIHFNSLYAITNLPISRFLNYLIESGNYDAYMEKLVGTFNPATLDNVMCKNTISVGWDGYLYDCDFNQMLDMKIAGPQNHISQFNEQKLKGRNILINQHCYGCTAGSGSSCGGEVI